MSFLDYRVKKLAPRKLSIIECHWKCHCFENCNNWQVSSHLRKMTRSSEVLSRPVSLSLPLSFLFLLSRTSSLRIFISISLLTIWQDWTWWLNNSIKTFFFPFSFSPIAWILYKWFLLNVWAKWNDFAGDEPLIVRD